MARSWLILLLVAAALASCAPQINPSRVVPNPLAETLTPWSFQTPVIPVESTLFNPQQQGTRAVEPAATPTPAIWRPPLSKMNSLDVSTLKVMGGQSDLAQLTELARWGKGSILYIDYTPDGNRLVLGTRRGISICDSNTLKEERFIEVAEGVPMLTVSPDGRTLVAASWTSRLTLYDLNKGTAVRSLDNGDHGAPLALRYLRDGRTISISTTGEINLMWEADTGKLLHRWYTTGNSSMAASPRGDVLVTSDWNGNIFMWNGADGRSTGRFWRDAEVQAVRVSPDGTLIAAAYGDGSAGVWDLLDAKMRYSLPHTDRVSALAFSPGGEILATGGWDNQVHLWRTSDGSLLRSFSGFSGRIRQVLFSPDNGSLAVLAGDGLLRTWRIFDGGLTAAALDYAGLRLAVFNGPGELTAAGDDGSLQFWSISSGERREVVDAQPAGMGSLAVSQDGKWMATGGMDGSVLVWSMPGADLEVELSVEEGWVNCLAISGDSRYLAACAPGRVSIWSLPQGEVAGEIRTGIDNPLRLAFTPDNMLAVGTQDGNLSLYRTNGGSPLKTLREDGKFISALAVSASGPTLATGGDENEISIWRVYNASLSQTIQGNKEDRLSAISFSPDGSLLAAAWWDGTLVFYRTSNGTSAVALKFNYPVRRVEFSTDGKLLALSLDDGTVRLWGMR